MFKLSKQKSFFLKSLISIAFVLWLIFKVKWQDVWMNLQHIQPIALGGYIALVLIGMLISAKKWQIIARYKGFQRSVGSCFHAYLTGAFINNFFPGFIGGDVYRAHWLGKIRESYSSAFSTTVFDRFTGLIAAAFLALVFSALQFEVVVASSLWTFCFVMLAILVIGIVFWGFIWKQVSQSFVVQSIVKIMPLKLQHFLAEVQHYFQTTLITPVMMLAIAFNFIGVGLANLVLFYAFGATVSPLNFFAVIFLISIISSLPLSINNIGIKEWAYYTFFALITVNSELAITVAIVGRFIQMLISFCALPEFLRRKQSAML